MGRYQIERVLGKGAMGIVYLARDPVIGRPVALKTLTISSDAEEGDEFRQRFLREAQAAGILNHPGIVTVFDAGVDEATGLSFIAMEYVEGKSLKDLQKSGRMFAYSEVARIGTALANALDYAHSKGVIHRDIKPANILMTAQGAVKITDFGVARLESSNLTATGQFIGTPNYMSPEQVAGTAIDGRSDLFSLGVAIFELLTGTRPFGGSSLTEVSYKIVNDAAPIPSQLRPALPPAFNPILLKLLEKDPARRYQRGADVARALDALRRVLAGLPSEAAAGSRSPAAAPAREGVASLSAAPTATRATTFQRAASDSVWRRPIALPWVVALLGVVVLVPATVIALLLVRIPRGPWDFPPAGEPARRHAIVEAVRRAERALTAGNPEEAERTLREVWDQAPYSLRARQLNERAAAMGEARQREQVRQEQTQRLREEGQELLRAGRVREAQARFEQALELTPDDALASEYLELARERGRSAATHRPTTRPSPTAGPTPATLAAPGRLELYFNCPLSSGTVELELDGQVLANKPFDFSTKGIFWLRKKGSGVIQDGFTIPSGAHRLTVRLRGGDGKLRGEESLAIEIRPSFRSVLKIEMEGERAVPRFTFTSTKGKGQD
ncbi:MAG: protein kinase [Acidobacteriota bacterium]